MRRSNALNTQAARRVLPLACAAALAMASAVTLTRPAQADDDERITPPPVPANIEVPAGQEAFLVGHATGTQNYVCLPSGSTFLWTLFTPQATLFGRPHRQLTTHFFSPNPFESGTPVRATWQHSRDTSSVWGAVVPGGSSSDPAFVAPGAIPWLLIQVVGAQDGPGGGHGRSRGALAAGTFIQRLNTTGGAAPATGCSVATDVGKRAFVPYTADYFFYRAEGPDHDH